MHFVLKALLPLLLSVFATQSIEAQPPKTETQKPDTAWWKEAIVYQLYPRSFKDSDGDGVGDLKGIIEKLDYLQSLGINTVWLNPVYASPNDDNGYDVSDYRSIMKEFGTMAHFDELLAGLHQRNIKLVMDLVVNHSSDEHEWFVQSRSSRTNKYRKYYHWWPAENGKPPYRYSLFDAAHDAWKYDSVTNAYYLHYFGVKQPDLNWEHVPLRQEIYEIMKFWARKGIDGFRLDAFQFAAKDTTWPAFPQGYEKQFVQYYGMQGNLHGYLQEMNREVLSQYPVMSVAEGAGNHFTDAHNLVDAHRKELNMAYAFDAVDLAKPEGYSVLKLKKLMAKWDSAFAHKGWLSIFLANHDQARMVTRYGNDSKAYREKSSKLLNMLILTHRGTPYCYNGDELGLPNAGFTSIKEFNDIQTINEYKYAVAHAKNADSVLRRIIFTSRDNGRTPFPWDGSAGAGFSQAKPWLRLAGHTQTINAALQANEPGSPLQFFRKLTAFRTRYKQEMVYGKYSLLEPDHAQLYMYTRGEGRQQFLVVLNMSNAPATTTAIRRLGAVQIELNNDSVVPKTNGSITSFEPWQAVIYRLP